MVPGNIGAVVLAGTVFQELVVWSAGQYEKSGSIQTTATVESSVMHRLKGHEGVLFSVAFHQASKMISTTSDDRTTRLWKIEELPEQNEDGEKQSVLLPNAANNSLSDLDWSKVEISLHKVLSGVHTSRVFRSIFLSDWKDKTSPSNIIATAGEDSRICLWNSETGTNFKTFVHDLEGKSSVWSLCSATLSPSKYILFRGGSNSAVKIWDFSVSENSDFTNSSKVETVEFYIPTSAENRTSNVENSESSALESEDQDYPRVIKHLNESSSVACLTNGGKVFVISFGETYESNAKWTLILEDDELFNYALMEHYSTPQEHRNNIDGCLVFSTLKGDVKLYKIWQNSKFQNQSYGEVSCQCSLLATMKDVHQGKIFAMSLLKEELFPTPKTTALSNSHSVSAMRSSFSILTCGDKGLLKLSNLTVQELKIEVNHLVWKLILPSKNEWKGQFWFACAILIDDRTLVVGDRAGNIHLYNHSKIDSQKCESPSQTFWKVHGRLGVGDLKLSQNKTTLWSTGRDGTIKSFSIEMSEESETFVKGTSLTKCKTVMAEKSCERLKISWPEKLILAKDGHIAILGFHSSNFIAFGLQENVMFCNVSCGGSHRSWDYGYTNDQLNFILTFIKNRKVVHTIVPGIVDKLKCASIASNPTRVMIRNALHSRELSCLHHFSMKHVNLNEIDQIEYINLIATAGEDTAIKIHRISGDDENIKRTRLSNLNGHISNVKCIESLTIENTVGDSSVILVSAGGRAQLKLWHICIDTKGSESDHMQYLPISCREIGSHLLKGNDKFRKKKSWKTSDLVIEDTETRYMDIDVCCKSIDSVPRDDSVKSNIEARGPIFIIAAACSDGVVRVLNVSTKKAGQCSELSSKANWYQNNLTIDVVAETSMHTHTFLRVRILNAKRQYNGDSFNVNKGQDGATIIIATSTDGKLYKIIYQHNCFSHQEGPMQMEIEEIASLHQSGINGLWLSQDNQRTADRSTVLVLTGGDDGAISIAELDNTGKLLDAYTSIGVSNSVPIHSAPITDICAILPSLPASKWNVENGVPTFHRPNDSDIMVATCSVDQRVCLWKVEPRKSKVYSTSNENSRILQPDSEIELLAVSKKFSSVPDIQAMAIWKKSKSPLHKIPPPETKNMCQEVVSLKHKTYTLAIVGVGLEIFTMDSFTTTPLATSCGHILNNNKQ